MNALRFIDAASQLATIDCQRVKIEGEVARFRTSSGCLLEAQAGGDVWDVTIRGLALWLGDYAEFELADDDPGDCTMMEV